VPVAVHKLTWEDIKDFPESHTRVELVDGELIMSPVPSRAHQRICSRLGSEIEPWVLRKQLGEFFTVALHVVLDQHVHYEPDLCFIRHDRLNRMRESYFDGSPDLIIEVISESNRSHDTVVKFRDYERFGVEEYWLVDPREKHVRIHHLEGGRYTSLGVFAPGEKIVTKVLTGLDLDPAQIFV
jgi:Uma2 family endonuclease